MFINIKTRLNCDLYEGHRAFCKDSKLESWGAVINDDNILIKTTQGDIKCRIAEHGDLNENIKPIIWTGFLGGEMQFKISFYRMNCTQKTEYCTEVQALIEWEDSLGIDDIERLKKAVGEMLEAVRNRYNKNWVIEDRDLNASILKGSF